MDIEDLVYTYSDYLYRIAFSYVRDRQVAEEAVQDVMLKFYQVQPKLPSEAVVKSYLTRMVINRSYDYLRSWKNKRNTMLEMFHLKGPGVDREVVGATESEELLRAVLNLSIKYREAIILYYYEDLSIKEISEMLSCPESTVKSRILRARKMLKKVLKDEEWEVLKDGQSL